ncbi:MAG: hypothetical protein KDB68_13230, partial [Planctomycetes bacterium]|nr:hypothetical protein [Planctomycetota bacterium]
MRHSWLLLIVLAFATSASAEEWVDFDTPTFGAGGVGTVARGATAARYNPANAAMRPWERGEDDPLTLEFNLPTSFAASIHGNDFQKMFDVVEDANAVFDQFQAGAFNNPTSATLSDYGDVFDIFNKLDILDS